MMKHIGKVIACIVIYTIYHHTIFRMISNYFMVNQVQDNYNSSLYYVWNIINLLIPLIIFGFIIYYVYKYIKGGKL
jgi:undecaprenyl pyrophosphate phosphatase UppP